MRRLRIAFPGGAGPVTNYPLSASGLIVASSVQDIVTRRGSTASTGGPFLAFSDLQSGPKSGNTDTSFGAVSGTDGAYVSVWGNRLGISQGASTITICGAECRVIYWGPAVPPWSPANLVNGYHDMQLVIAQVMGTAADGLGTIRVTVNSVQSNTLPFTVRTGRILYIKPDGTSGGTGAWTSPITFGVFNQKVNQSGDTVYVKDVTNLTTQWIGTGGLSGCNGGTMSQDRPGAIVAYPGSVVQMGAYSQSSSNEAFTFYDGDKANVYDYPGLYPPWWILSKLVIRGYRMSVVLKVGRSRLVGCNYSLPGALPGDVGNLPIFGASPQRLHVLGNEFHHIGSYNTWSHVEYISSDWWRSVPADNPSSPRYHDYPAHIEGAGEHETAWNYFHDNACYDALHYYQQNGATTTIPKYLNTLPASSTDYTYSSYCGGGFAHHNVIENQAGCGMSWTSMNAGDAYVWSNIIVRAGATVPYDTGWSSGTSTFDSSCGLRITGGVYNATDLPLAGGMRYHIFHNTIFDCGHGGANGAGEFGGWARYQMNYGLSRTEDIHNNITYLPGGQPYIAVGRVPPGDFTAAGVPDQAADAWDNNLWGGTTSQSTTWDASAVVGDPLFLNPAMSGAADVHLQAGSPAVGTARSVPYTPPGFDLYDFDGQPLPIVGGQDIGALQRV